ncbi:MAG: S1C family serine protease [Clostridium sp.]|uniref:S1C family serine protease n=1 Tax=Clostridium sp. TaxID=1506 RepID=UPI00305F47EC
MSNFNDDYKDARARITFNKIKKRRSGKIILITIVCLFIASSSGVAAALVMMKADLSKEYYLQDDDENISNTNKTQIQSVVKKVSESVVSVIKIINDGTGTKESNIGVGIVVDNGEYIVTSYSGIRDASSVKIKLYDDAVYNVNMVGFDSVYDVAMLKIEGQTLVPINVIDNKSKIKTGDKVISIGNPIGNSFNESIEGGMIINTRESIVFKNPEAKASESLKMIKTNVKPKYINTGAALFNLEGELIGVNNRAMAYHSEFSKNSFYMAVEDLYNITNGILDKQDSLLNYMGVYGEEAVSPRENGVEGVYAKEVTRNGIAYEAGIRPTDIIVEVNDVKVNSVSDINSIMDEFKSGDTIKCMVFKNGVYVNLDIKISDGKNKK